MYKEYSPQYQSLYRKVKKACQDFPKDTWFKKKRFLKISAFFLNSAVAAIILGALSVVLLLIGFIAKLKTLTKASGYAFLAFAAFILVYYLLDGWILNPFCKRLKHKVALHAADVLFLTQQSPIIYLVAGCEYFKLWQDGCSEAKERLDEVVNLPETFDFFNSHDLAIGGKEPTRTLRHESITQYKAYIAEHYDNNFTKSKDHLLLYLTNANMFYHLIANNGQPARRGLEGDETDLYEAAKLYHAKWWFGDYSYRAKFESIFRHREVKERHAEIKAERAAQKAKPLPPNVHIYIDIDGPDFKFEKLMDEVIAADLENYKQRVKRCLIEEQDCTESTAEELLKDFNKELHGYLLADMDPFVVAQGMMFGDESRLLLERARRENEIWNRSEEIRFLRRAKLEPKQNEIKKADSVKNAVQRSIDEMDRKEADMWTRALESNSPDMQKKRLDSYKQQVKDCLMKDKNRAAAVADKFIQDYDAFFPEFWEEDWTPIMVATAMLTKA